MAKYFSSNLSNFVILGRSFSSPAHPFMLADNRHYVFYVGENLDWQIKQMASLSIF